MSEVFGDPAELRVDPEALEDEQRFVLEVTEADIRHELIERFGLTDLQRFSAEGSILLRHGLPHVSARLSAEVGMTCSVSLDTFTQSYEEVLETYFVPESDLPQLQDDESMNEPLADDGLADVGEFLMQSFSLLLPDIPRKSGLEPLEQSFGPQWEPEEKPNPFAALAGLKTKGDASKD